MVFGRVNGVNITKNVYKDKKYGSKEKLFLILETIVFCSGLFVPLVALQRGTISKRNSA